MDTSGFALQKPKDKEGKVTLSAHGRRKLLDELCKKQAMKCCSCGRQMTRETGLPNSATLGHDQPQPMGCKKRDNPDNILGAQCAGCNLQRGSKRK